ncbi:MAG: flagellar basal-body MS-ring/collar protein FliF, partial [Nitrospinota bacterium]|nr:flagellar basal-body MS-ring/collar protein FliF [Nitrospinota bacterium]
MEPLLNILKQLNEQFQELSQGRKMAFFGLLAAAVASLFVMAIWMQAPDYQLLYANLSEKDAAAIVEELKTQNIPYELGASGTTVRIPVDKVHETRIQLAAQGLPAGSEVGLEIFEETALGMTDFVQKLNFQRALQGELARTIKSLEPVDQARVHLVIPKENVFLREKPQGKASVTLKIKASRQLSESQIQGIAHVVASSVKGIPPENVTVVDLKGNILSGAKGASQDTMLTSTNFKFKRKLETQLENSTKKMLEDALGEGKVIVRVAAELSFDKVNRTEEIYDPDSQVVRSEQRTNESTVGAVPPGGVAGVQALLPTGQTEAGSSGSAAKRNKEKQTFNYEINKVVRNVSKPTGEILKLSVAVMVDGTVDENGQFQPRSAQDIARYEDIVKSAVGFDEERGDQVKVEAVQFNRSLQQQQEEKLLQESRIELGFQVAKYVLGAIFILLFFTRVIRPMV